MIKSFLFLNLNKLEIYKMKLSLYIYMDSDKKMRMADFEVNDKSSDIRNATIKSQKQENENNGETNQAKDKNTNQQTIDLDTALKYIEELKQKNDELEKKLLYLAAEYENSKKRNKIDLENAIKFAISKFALDVVCIYDVLQTALQNIDPKKTDKVLADGVKMTISEFDKMFNRINIKKIQPEVGSVFDHNKHEAISRAKSKLEIGCITEVVRAGYELHERLLRPAMVIVSSGEE